MDESNPITTVFARVVQKGSETLYEAWLKDVRAAASTFIGYRGMTVLVPTASREEYTAITHFDSETDADRWLCSDERRSWLEKLGTISIEREEITSLTGMERWFTLPGCTVSEPPPQYKTAIMILVGLYPISLTMEYALKPVLVELPVTMRLLVALIVSVSIMVWGVMPLLTRIFYQWLYPRDKRPSV
ncbi:MAG: antibiotic biosynthesis monooxygenase (ABM) superfamily enzyme [Planctomycetota bacterium]|jgi:antibiotic biosynthesis monooxygenase (ABM) superfamily enzyme